MKIMQAIACLHPQTFLVTFMLIYLTNLSHLEARNGGFSVDLIHRNSPLSPLYNTHYLETPLTHFKNGFQRAISRVNRLRINQNNPQSEVFPDNGEHIMKFSIGTPPMDIYGIVDTGSDLFWTQCQPCEQCYKQINPIYNPKSSSTYADINCNSAECHLLDTVSCSTTSLCNYTYGYGSGALSKGVLAEETITFNGGRQSVSFNNVIFGCGHNNTGGFNENEMGLVGLGGRKLSLTSQIGSSLGSRKFSYCLVPFHTDPKITSKMHFGSDSEVIGEGVVSTPLVQKEDKTPYFVTLTGISVGQKFLHYNSSSTEVAEGNVFIDSGVPPILLPTDFYNRLEEEVKNSIEMTPYQDPDLGTQLCYRSNKIIDAPILLVQFGSGGQIPLVPSSTFISPKEDVFCFAMAPTDADIGIFGNFAQSNFRIGFDLERQIVSFKQADCSNN